MFADQFGCCSKFFIKILFTIKSFPILTCIYTNLKLQLIGCNQAKYVGRGTCLEWLSPLGKSSASLGMSVSDPQHGMASRKSHVSELKNWMPMHSKKQKKPSVGVELRAGRQDAHRQDPHRSEKPGWSVGDMRQWPQVSGFSHKVLLLVILTCSKSVN